jgi:hypothetical protein
MKQFPQAMAMPNIHIGIEGCDPRNNAQGLAEGIDIDARSRPFGEFAFHQMRNTASEFDDFQPALNIALGIGDHLAMLGREKAREAVHLLLDQRLEIEHHAGAALRVRGGPGGEDRARGVNGGMEFSGVRQRHARLHLAGRRIEHIAEAGGYARDVLAVDEMGKGFHGSFTKMSNQVGQSSGGSSASPSSVVGP